MKHLLDIINEDKIKYSLSEDYIEKTTKVLNELIDTLPSIPNVAHVNHMNRIEGEFWFNEWDLLRSPIAESAEYIGHPQTITLDLNTKRKIKFDVEVAKEAFRQIFGMKINEGIFDDNISKISPEWQWVNDLYTALSKFFKTKTFSKVNSTYSSRYNSYPAGIFKILKSLPTVEKDGLIMTLYAIKFDSFEPNYEYCGLKLQVFVYERKDVEKVATIKAQNDARKPLDIVGRELLPGDTVAYAILGGYSGYKGMMTGSITKVNKDMVEVDGHRLRADRCCLISRKDGKRIE